MVREFALTRAPLPAGDPRVWLVDELMVQGAQSLPTLLMAGTDTERWVVTDVSERTSGRAEAALREQPGVEWTGGWGNAVLWRDGRPLFVSHVRLRWLDDSVFVRVWGRLPGVAPSAALAQGYEGPLGDIPSWMAPLFPALVSGRARFVERPLHPADWASDLRAPDMVLEYPRASTERDIVTRAAHALEARFATGGTADPVAVAWNDEALRLWWVSSADEVPDLHAIVHRLSRDPRTRGVGLFGLGEDLVGSETVQMIAMLCESRSGEAWLWARRFRRLDGNHAEWVDDSGFLRDPDDRVGWFEE